MTKTFLGQFYATQKPFFLPSLERPTPFPISTSLCYISLFSGCQKIIMITQRSVQRFFSWATNKLITEPTEILSVFTRDFRESQ